MSETESQPGDRRLSPNCTLTPAWLPQVEVRLLVNEDLPALEWEGEFAHFRRLYRQIYENTREGKALMWVVDLPGAGVIGQLFVQLESSRKELADGVTRAYLYGFRIRPSYRSFGLGARLLKTVEAYLVQRNYRWATLNVNRDNLEARCFYEKHGYRVTAAEPGRWTYQDEFGRRRQVHEPAWRMHKQLPSGG